MTPKALQSRSKYLSKVLRHAPELIHLTLDKQGWVPVESLLSHLNHFGPEWLQPFSRYTLEEIVAGNNKQRFAFSEDGLRIRANQGHSLAIDLQYPPQEPPLTLFHGTARKNLASIEEKGLVKGSRHQVHLSVDKDTAHRVGCRHGSPVVLSVRSGDMWRDGYIFYRSDNGVWLTDAVPASYLALAD